MIILALVSVIQTGAIFRYRHRKKIEDSQNPMSYEITLLALRNRVLNVSESTRIHWKLLDRLHLTLILNPS